MPCMTVRTLGTSHDCEYLGASKLHARTLMCALHDYKGFNMPHSFMQGLEYASQLMQGLESVPGMTARDLCPIR